jgi:hypothetical protein
MVAQPLKDVKAVHAGHLQVHENDIRSLAAWFGERRLTLEVGNDFLAVADDLKRADASTLLESELENVNVAGCVLACQDVQLPLTLSQHLFRIQFRC